MSDLQNMRNLNAGDRVDAALRSYFQSEMPSPWPEPRRVELATPPRRSVVNGLLRHAGRMALAASIAALVAGYLALTALFPPERSQIRPNGPTLGLKGDGKTTVRPNR